MARGGLYLVAYDVTDDKERGRVAKVLEGFGFRTQLSVFECRLTRSGLNRLLERLKRVEPESGFVGLYRLDEQARRHVVGKRPDPPEDDDDYAFVVKGGGQ